MIESLAAKLPLILLASAGGENLSPDPEGHVLPHLLFGSDWFTNHHLMSLVALVLGVAILWYAAGRMVVHPDKGLEGYVTHGRFTQIIELLCVFLRDSMTRPLLGKLTDKYIYMIWSFFFFILLGNLLGMLPISAVLGLLFGGEWSHVGGTFTGNINFTAGLAIVAFVLIHAISIRENGFGYIKHMWPVPMKPLWLSPLFLIVNIFILFLELILGPAIKAFALCVRLFANMVAGHLVLGSLIIMTLAIPIIVKPVSIGGAAIFSFLELFVAFLQAYIFTFLLVIFISLGAVSHDEHEEHEHAGDETDPPKPIHEELTGVATAHA